MHSGHLNLGRIHFKYKSNSGHALKIVFLTENSEAPATSKRFVEELIEKVNRKKLIEY